MVRIHTQGLGVRSTSQQSLHLERQCYVSTVTTTIRRFHSDLNLSVHMESGLHQMGIASHSPVRVSSSQEVSEGSQCHTDSMWQYSLNLCGSTNHLYQELQAQTNPWR
eukprot:898400-Amphidinium_carterae.3